jgi:hypothetical protein
MQSYPCPHCGQRTIPLWRRALLGPAWPTVCSDCGKGVGVPWSSMRMVFLGMLLILVGDRIAARFGLAIEIWVVAVLLGLVLAAWVRWVPLEKR